MDVTPQYSDSQMLCSMETQGEARKLLQPNMENDPKLQELKKFLIDWINQELHQEHIVVKDLEEDLFDGLILHHLLQKIGGIKLEVEEITLSANNQKRKVAVILEAVSQCLQLDESQLKWSVDLIHNKDLLATLHLLIALAKHFRPDLTIPANVSVEVVVVEPTRSGMRTAKAIECLTGAREQGAANEKDAFDHLFDTSPDKINDVKQAIVNFVNKQLVNLSLTVTDLESQFADGVILLLLIGQVQGYFINLSTFFLCPQSTDDKEFFSFLGKLCATKEFFAELQKDVPTTTRKKTNDRLLCQYCICMANKVTSIECSNPIGCHMYQLQQLHNVTFALDLLKDGGILQHPVSPTEIVNRDLKATLRVLYSLLLKHKNTAESS